jgi:hypothetical protein
MTVLALIFACGGAAVDSAADGSLAEAETLFASFGDLTTWGQPPGWEGVKVSCDGSHGPRVQVWADAAALGGLAAGAAVFPDGATLVKAAYDEDGTTLRNHTVMQKRAGSAPDAGDWYWARLDASGAATHAGSQAMCADCHAGAAVDYAFTATHVGADDASACAR